MYNKPISDHFGSGCTRAGEKASCRGIEVAQTPNMDVITMASSDCTTAYSTDRPKDMERGLWSFINSKAKFFTVGLNLHKIECRKAIYALRSRFAWKKESKMIKIINIFCQAVEEFDFLCIYYIVTWNFVKVCFPFRQLIRGPPFT